MTATATIEGERDDLRRRLDQSEEERRATQPKLTAPLIDQRAKPEPPKGAFGSGFSAEGRSRQDL